MPHARRADFVFKALVKRTVVTVHSNDTFSLIFGAGILRTVPYFNQYMPM